MPPTIAKITRFSLAYWLALGDLMDRLPPSALRSLARLGGSGYNNQGLLDPWQAHWDGPTRAPQQLGALLRISSAQIKGSNCAKKTTSASDILSNYLHYQDRSCPHTELALEADIKTKLQGL
jgi:hypothetical protein